jgi:hypothetical protein
MVGKLPDKTHSDMFRYFLSDFLDNNHELFLLVCSLSEADRGGRNREDFPSQRGVAREGCRGKNGSFGHDGSGK